MSRNLTFRVSSALKDIIGRDLITDDFVAIFELVKNSYDAHANRVDIIFEHLGKKNGKIIIKDNGKGMSYNDIINKWLFVAYSAKQEGTEDNDYIHKINKNKIYAGAKGIGRFSCDRLGKKLTLMSKAEIEANYNILKVDWEDFEKSLKDNFSDIEVIHTLGNAVEHDLSNGTILEISNLRNEWDRQKLLALKASLSKLINPNIGAQEDSFKIFMHVEDLKSCDDDFKEDRERVNGEIKNFIFETLKLKTTKIQLSISENGENVTSILEDGGRMVYNLREKNRFKTLKNIDIYLFYLNQSAKLTFAKHMGVSTTGYGHIFLYKNGFRIYPYGEPGEDPLKVNTRYAQGYNRYLGLRNLIGRIEIGEPNPQLKETTSRADGLIKTKSYYEMEDAFWLALKRLERYVIDVQKWGIQLSTENEKDQDAALINLVSKLTDADDIVNIEYGEDFYSLLNEAESESALGIVAKIKTIASNTKNDKLAEAVILTERRIKEMQSAMKEAERESSEKSKLIKSVESEKREIERQNLLLKRAVVPDTVEMLSIEHHINQATHRVDKTLQKLIHGIQESKPLNTLIDYANRISLENRKISSLINFIRKANFDTMSSSFTGDLITYISQYTENIYSEDPTRIINKQIVDVAVHFLPNDEFILEFVPLEVNIILDNLLDNSFKAHATKVDIYIKTSSDTRLEITYKDDGLGIDKTISDRIFEFGFTTTDGSGIGLFHIKQILENDLKGNISLNKSIKQGVEFHITINK
ncbi:ATP-binding protein [Olivibacter jilunii]|uniref:ATP-binding protein n=1 Tax=Olivibacter jilunii TaxID=985016 RepID=UPI003F18E584